MEPDERPESTAPLPIPVFDHDVLRAALRSRAGVRQALLLAQVLAVPVAVQRAHRQARHELPLRPG